VPDQRVRDVQMSYRAFPSMKFKLKLLININTTSCFPVKHSNSKLLEVLLYFKSGTFDGAN